LGNRLGRRRVRLRRRDRGNDLVRGVRGVEVAEVEPARRNVVDDRYGQRRAVGAADLVAEDVVDDVLAWAAEGGVAIQVLLEVDLARRRLDEPLLDARAVGRA